MKKIITLVASLLVLLCASAALAEGMGVQVIGGPAVETEPVSLDDMKMNVDAEIEGWGILTLTKFAIQDKLGYFDPGEKGASRYTYDQYYSSGNEAEFVLLFSDILNTTLSAKDYLESVSVKAVYDDVYEYGGWAYQRNYNYGVSDHASVESDKRKQNINWAINKADQFAIDPMYEGHYIYGCTLPNAVINSTKPLKLVITIDGNELTYNIRK